MKRSKRTGSHLFFIEFIIVLFFFLIVSTVCLRLFAQAHGITQRADALSHAQAAAASVAAAVEDILAEDPSISSQKADSRTTSADSSDISDGATADPDHAKNLLQTAAGYLPGASLSALPDDPSGQEGIIIFYDKEFQTCAADDARYLLTAAVEMMSGQDGQVESGKAMESLHISVTDYDHAPVYELTVALHRPATREEALQ